MSQKYCPVEDDEAQKIMCANCANAKYSEQMSPAKAEFDAARTE